MISDVDLIEQTLERLADAKDDITPLVYQRFFRRSPDAEPLFVQDDGLSGGRMLNEVLMTLLDQAAGLQREQVRGERSCRERELERRSRPGICRHLAGKSG